MANSYEERLGTDRMLPLIFRMALPAVAAQIVNLLYNIVDRIYIGHIPGYGTDALAGIGVTGSIIMLITACSAFVGGGGAPLAAIALGRGDRGRAEKLLGNGFTLLLFFSVMFSVGVYLFMEPLLFLIGASERTIGYAVDYLSIYLLGTVFVQLAVGLNPFINTQGRPRIAMASVVIGAVLNIALDPLFIFTFDMGVKGAAVATVISQAVCAVWVMGFLMSEKATLRLHWKNIRPDSRVMLAILGLGISPFRVCAQQFAGAFRRPLCQCACHHAERHALCQRAACRILAGICPGGGLQLRPRRQRPREGVFPHCGEGDVLFQSVAGAVHDIVPRIGGGRVYRRCPADCCRGRIYAAFPCRNDDFRPATCLSEHVRCAWSGKSVGVHCIVAQGHFADTACAPSLTPCRT